MAHTQERIWMRNVRAAATSAGLDKQFSGLLHDQANPRSFLDALIEQGCVFDAIRFVAHLLPSRHAVWWGCLCITSVNDRLCHLAVDEAARSAAIAWVLEPGEETRSAAESAGWAAGIEAPAGALALAVSWTGGVDPTVADSAAEARAARVIAGAILLAAALVAEPDPARLPKLFLDWGVTLADLSQPWSASSQPASSV
jgi:hypothetical protein